MRGLFFRLWCVKKWMLIAMLFLTQNYTTIQSKTIAKAFPTHFLVEQDSFRIQLFHESSGATIQKVNVFNTCDFSSTESLRNGTVNIELEIGECCDFTFSKADFATKEITLCATATKNGIQLTEPSKRKEISQLNVKSVQSIPSEPPVYKDVDKNIYVSNKDEQPFTGLYKGQVYQNGQLNATDFCCAYSVEEKEEELIDRKLTFVKKGIRPASLFKIGLQSQVRLRVKGWVLDEKHEFPIEEAKVILMNKNNQKDSQIRLTNLDGIFDFSLRKNECYELLVKKENYTQVGAPIEICTNQSTVSQSFEFNIFLQ